MIFMMHREGSASHHVSIDPQTLVKIPERDFENELVNDPDFGAVIRASWPADQPCAGITFRVQAYSACLTSHQQNTHREHLGTQSLALRVPWR